MSKADYLRFFREVLDYYEQDFPQRIIERETFAQVPPLELLKPTGIARWAAVEAAVYEFTGQEEYLLRANELLRAMVEGIQYTPRELWGYFLWRTREGAEACRKAYQHVPEEAKWHGRPWAHISGFSVPLPLALTCQSLNRVEGWESPKHRQEAEAALAQIVNHHVSGESQYRGRRGGVHNISMTMARGIFIAAQLIPDHLHAEQWRQWAMETFQSNFDQASPEDASNYESDWFHSALVVIDTLNKGEEAYYLPHYRAYFEHLKEMVTSAGSCVGYGDSFDYGNAGLLPVLEKGAAVFRDGTYKYAAQLHFEAVQTLPMEEKAYFLQSAQKSYFLQTTRWLDAYRWADDSISPEPPQAGGTITNKAMIVLRSGSCPDQTYLALSSLDGGGHGHFDANTIAHFSSGSSELLRDGYYQWNHAFFHNRLLWRKGRAPGAILDYFRPKHNPPHHSPDGSEVVFASEGSAQGTPDKWHPAEQTRITVKFLARFPQFRAARSILGPQERTIVMDDDGHCLIFDHLRAQEMISAVCLYYTPDIVERGEWWARGSGMPENSAHDLLIASLEPRQLSAEAQKRRDTIEQVVYSSRIGAFPSGAWFVTALWPQSKQASIINLADVLDQHTIEDGDGLAQVVTVSQEDSLVTFVCRGAHQGDLLRYRPIDPDGNQYPWDLKSDADLLRLEPTDQGLQVSMVNGTILQVEDQQVISLHYRGHQQTIIREFL